MMNRKSTVMVMLWALSLGAMAAEQEEVTGRSPAPDRETTSGESVPAAADAEGSRGSDANQPLSNSSPSAASERRSPSARTADRLELDTTVVTGNRELPKVLYIVPWKKADIGELPGQPFNTLLDEALMPVDRDVFRREVTYYDAVTGSSDATQSTSSDQR